jgi:hypothetical protein
MDNTKINTKYKTYNILAFISSIFGIIIFSPFPLAALILGYLGKYESQQNNDIKYIKIGKSAIIIAYFEIAVMLILSLVLFYLQHLMEQF